MTGGALTVTGPNPDPRHDYLVRLDGRLGSGVRVCLDWVPDRRVLAPGAFAVHLATLDSAGGLEALALALLDAVTDSLLPRWLQVSVEATVEGVRHRVVVEDRQPGWDNPGLLRRLGPALPEREPPDQPR